MGAETTIGSTLIYPKIISGNVSLPLAAGTGQLFTVDEVFDISSAFNLFFTIDDEDYLFTIRVALFASTINGFTPVFRDRVHALDIDAYYSINGTDPATGIVTQGNSFVIGATNFDTLPHVVNLKYFIYAERTVVA